MSRIYMLLMCFLISSQIIVAGCGGCRTNKRHTSPKTVLGLLEKVPANNRVEGNVLVSCGMCNFLTGDNDCALAVKIGSRVLKVDGVGIDDHGDSHASDGYCNVIKKKYVEELFERIYFYPLKWTLPKFRIFKIVWSTVR